MESTYQFRVGDVAEVIPYEEVLAQCGTSYGITKAIWDLMVKTNPHVVAGKELINCYSLQGEWIGLGWPVWALRPAYVDLEVDVDDLL